MKRLVAVLLALVGGAGVVLSAQDKPGDADLAALLDKATAYVTNYVKALSSVVAEERYEQSVQRLDNRGRRANESRILVSDYLLVQVPGSNEWMPFRDVYSVDGRMIHDRSDRLLKLFLDPKPTSLSRALQIRDESSRFNIGDVTRDINVPTFALEFLQEDMRRHAAFHYKSRDQIDGVEVVVVEYEEMGRPTLIVGAGDENVPASGQLWIAADSGAVLRTILQTKPRGMRTRIVVDYRPDPTLKILVPSQMSEEHGLLEQTVRGKATYSNYRRFKVETTIEIK